MLSDVLKEISNWMPKMNPVIYEGVAYHQLPGALHYVERLLSIAFRPDENATESLPEGFRFESCTVLDPLESYQRRVQANLTSERRRYTENARGYDMLATDNYLVEANIRIGKEGSGELIKRPMTIPFCHRGGYTHVRGTRYAIMAVLKTPVLSMDKTNSFFIKFPRMKTEVSWCGDSMYVNGVVSHNYVPYSFKFHQGAETKTGNRPLLIYWLFAKHGIMGAIKRHLGIEMSFYEIDDPVLQEIDREQYAVCTNKDPVGGKRGPRVNLAIVVKKEDLSEIVEIYINSIFHAARLHPHRITPDYIHNVNTWKIALGTALFKKGRSEVLMVDEIDVHFANFERTMDIEFMAELMAEGIECEDIYDFIHHIITRVANHTNSELPNAGNMYGKYLTVTEYVLRGITRTIYNVHWQLVKKARSRMAGVNKKERPKGDGFNSLILIVNREINLGLLRDMDKQGELTPFSTSCSNMVFGLTCHSIDQTDAKERSENGHRAGIDIHDPANHLHHSYLECGSVANLPKSMPIGRARINMYVKLGPTGQILPDPRKAAWIRKAQLVISERTQKIYKDDIED